MIADAVIFLIAPVDLPPKNALKMGNRLENRHAILAPPAEIINLAWSGIEPKRLESLDNIIAMNVVTHLFTFIAEDRIGSASDGDLNQIIQKAV